MANPQDVEAILGQDATMPIAIVGIAGRFPGDATTPEKLWELISNGRSALCEKITPDRFNVDAFYHPHGEHRGTTNVRAAHLLKDDVARWDAPFFSITAQEAQSIDPQQGMALEIAYEALENAGIKLDSVTGSSTACYMSSFTADYAAMRIGDVDDFPRYFANSNMSMLSNRISWFFNLKGPSMGIDSACSSSLVGLHLACQSLKLGEADMALVGATNAILAPHTFCSMSNLNFLSPDGKSMTFDHKANGYSRGEGVCVIVVKPLAAAIRDKNVIRAIVRNTAVNQDGRTPGINLPSSEAQEALIKSAYAEAGLAPHETGYFEAHGTGTPAGDPKEAAAVAAALDTKGHRTQPLAIGSIKTNIGHIEGVAGLAGLVKTVYSLERGQIAPHLWFEKANPAIPLDDWGLRVPTKLLSWPTAGIRRASVNSFGYGGTNAHCILDDARHYLQSRGIQGLHNTVEVALSTGTNGSTEARPVAPRSSEPEHLENVESAHLNGHVSHSQDGAPNGIKHGTKTPQLLTWSSHDQAGLARTAAGLTTYLTERPNPGSGQELLERLATTLSDHRTRLPWASFTVALDFESASKALENPAPPKRLPAGTPETLFVFTGQGAQWPEMGRELLAYAPFEASIKAATAHLKQLGCAWDLLDEIMAEDKTSRIHEPSISQPACTALQVALVDLLATWDVQPSAVVGHSSGEIAAAYAKKAITAGDAWTISYHRGRLTDELAEPGAMLAVGAGEDAVRSRLESMTGATPSIACINSPISVTLSGTEASLDEAESLLVGAEISCKRLFVRAAYHSPAMKAVAQPYRDALAGMGTVVSKTQRPVRMVSSVTGAEIDDATLASPQYWVDNMVSPVRFSDAVAASLGSMAPASAPLLLEVGPHGALQGPLQQILAGREGKRQGIPQTSVLTRKQDAAVAALTTVGFLLQHGHSAGATKANSPTGTRETAAPLVDLPPYPWNHNTRYSSDSPALNAFRGRKEPRHDLLGALCPLSSHEEPRWRNYLRLSEVPWLRHHKIQGSILFPFSGMLAIAIEAARQSADPHKTIRGIELRDVIAGTALILADSDDEPRETLLQLRPWRNGSRALASQWREFSLSSRDRQGAWTHHSNGLVTVHYDEDGKPNPAFADERASAAEGYRATYDRLRSAKLKEDNFSRFYAEFARLGSDWGPTFRPIVELRSKGSEALCTLEIQDTASWMPMNHESRNLIHPATLDGVFQLLIAPAGRLDKDRPGVPKAVERVYVSPRLPTAPGQRLYGFSRKTDEFFNEMIGTIVVSDAAWTEPLVLIEGFKNVELESLTGGGGDSASQARSAAVRKLGAYPSWELDVENSPAAALAVLRKTWAAAPSPPGHVVHDLELAAYLFCRRATRRFSAQDAEAFAPHHRLFYAYMRRQCELAAAGALPRQTPSWRDLGEADEAAVLARVAAATLDGKLLCRIGAHTERMLRGEVEPLEVMREDNLLSEFYHNALSDEKTPAVLCAYLRRLSHKRPLRVLEVGAGTGGATSRLMASAFGSGVEAASRLEAYTYTDISSGFFEAAQDEFAEWKALFEYKVLDVERDPAAQGLLEASYDVVLAFQVLHATADLDAVLANCRKMLKPGGQLIIFELTSTLARTPMVFGVLPGWWNGEDDGRKWGPRLTEAEWESRMVKQGFSSLEWSFRDCEDENYNASLLVARVPKDHVSTLPSEVTVVVPSPSEAQSSLALPLAARLQERLEFSGVKVRTLAFDEISEIDLSGQACVSMLDLDDALLTKLEAGGLAGLKHIVFGAQSTLWITQGAALDNENTELGLWAGLSRTFRSETHEVRLATLDLDPGRAYDEATLDVIEQQLRLQRDPANSETEFAERGGALYIERVRVDERLSKLVEPDEEPEPTLQPLKQAGRPLKLELKTPGAVETFRFGDDLEHDATPLGPHEVETEIKAVGLDMHDVAIVMGQIWEPDLGVQYSGVVSRVGAAVTRFAPGDRVLSGRDGWYRTFLRSDEALVQKIPDGLSFEEGATMVISYVTALYCVFDVARLEPGESILIHAGAGALGRTVIELAHHLGADVFVTVSSKAKKDFLVKNYQIPAAHIFTNRDLSFVSGIKRLTGGKGVDVVLNSTVGEMLRQTWNCIAPFGRFIELGLKDIEGNTGLDMAPFGNNCSYHGVNVMRLWAAKPRVFGRLMGDVMRYFREGVITLVGPINAMPFSDVAAAFLTMQTRRRTGKVVLTVEDDDLVPVLPRKELPLALRPDATYIVPGGLGGLGRSVALRMAERGARYLVFTSRSGAKDPRAQGTLEDLSELGVKTKVFTKDIGEPALFREVLEEIESSGFPRIRGVITFAMQLKDVFVRDMTIDEYWAAVGPKYRVTKNLLDLLSPGLDFFVCMSSIAGVVGSMGQGNYNAGNTYQDAVCSRLRARGVNAASICLGVVADIGFVAEHAANLPHLQDALKISEKQVLTLVEAAMAGRLEGVSPVVGLRTGGMLRAVQGHEPHWFEDPRLVGLRVHGTQEMDAGEGGGAGGKRDDLAATLSEVEGVDAAAEVVCEAMRGKLARGLMMDVEDLDPGRPVNAYGVDSLVAVELRAWAKKEVRAEVSVFEILSNIPMSELARMLAGRSGLVAREGQGDEAAENAETVNGDGQHQANGVDAAVVRNGEAKQAR